MKNAATALMCFVVGYFMGIQAPLRGTVQSVPPHSSAASAAECSKAASDVGHSLESGHPLSSDFLDAEEYPCMPRLSPVWTCPTPPPANPAPWVERVPLVIGIVPGHTAVFTPRVC